MRYLFENWTFSPTNGLSFYREGRLPLFPQKTPRIRPFVGVVLFSLDSENPFLDGWFFSIRAAPSPPFSKWIFRSFFYFCPSSFSPRVIPFYLFLIFGRTLVASSSFFDPLSIMMLSFSSLL